MQHTIRLNKKKKHNRSKRKKEKAESFSLNVIPLTDDWRNEKKKKNGREHKRKFNFTSFRERSQVFDTLFVCFANLYTFFSPKDTFPRNPSGQTFFSLTHILLLEWELLELNILMHCKFGNFNDTVSVFFSFQAILRKTLHG